MTATASESTDASDYQAWKAMGQGGIPATYSGYMTAKSYEKTVAHKDTLSPALYQQPEKYALGWSKATPAQKAAAYRSFLQKPLPQREGPRARAKPFVFPQRERNAAEPKEAKVKVAYEAIFAELGKANAASTEWKTSALEKQGAALFLKSDIPMTPLVATVAQGEICHIHGTDLSGHVTLSFADAEEVIAKGWGERHRLSGTEMIHLGYTMVYVPRTVEETEVLGRIFQAGLEFMRCVE